MARIIQIQPHWKHHNVISLQAPMRQTRLAFDPNNSLVVDARVPISLQSTDLEGCVAIFEDELPRCDLDCYAGPPHILRLPDELLNEVLTIASQREPIEPTYSSLAGEIYRAQCLTLVCRRFYRLAVALQYRTIKIGRDNKHGRPGITQRIRALHRSLSANPNSGASCRDLRLHVPGKISLNSEEHDLIWRQLDDLTCWLSRVEKLEITEEYNSSIHSPEIGFLKKVPERMNRVREIALMLRELSLQTLIKFASAFPCLEYLKVACIKRVGDPSIEWECPESLRRQGPFTRLDLFYYDGTIGELQQLILWPKELRHFSIVGHDQTTDFETSALIPHMDTLRSIKMESINAWADASAIINVANFPTLEAFTIDMRSVNCTPEEAAPYALGPRVENIGFSYHYNNGQGQASLMGFQEPEADWIRRFVEFASERESPLKRVHIDFQADLLSIRSEPGLTTADYMFPWDRMDKLAEEVKAEFGVSVTYEESYIPRKRWDEEIRKILEPERVGPMLRWLRGGQDSWAEPWPGEL